MLSFCNLLVVLVVWTAASTAWLAAGSSAIQPAPPPASPKTRTASALHPQSKGKISYTNNLSSRGASPLSKLPVEMFTATYMLHLGPPPLAMVYGQFRDFEMKCHDQLRQSPDIDRATGVDVRSSFALHRLRTAAVALARAHGATSAQPYFLPDDLFGGINVWRSLMLRIPTRTGDAHRAIPADMGLLRLPRNITDLLDPTKFSFEDSTLDSWFRAHDYVFPLPPMQFGEDDTQYYGRLLRTQAKTAGKQRLTKRQTERLLIEAMVDLGDLGRGILAETPELREVVPSLCMLLEDLVGQSHFVQVIKDVNYYAYTSPVIYFLACGVEEQAYNVIRVAQLVMSVDIVIYAMRTRQPGVLQKIFELAKECLEQWSLTWGSLLEYIESKLTSPGYLQSLTPDAEAGYKMLEQNIRDYAQNHA